MVRWLTDYQSLKDSVPIVTTLSRSLHSKGIVQHSCLTPDGHIADGDDKCMTNTTIFLHLHSDSQCHSIQISAINSYQSKPGNNRLLMTYCDVSTTNWKLLQIPFQQKKETTLVLDGKNRFKIISDPFMTFG